MVALIVLGAFAGGVALAALAVWAGDQWIPPLSDTRSGHEGCPDCCTDKH